MSCTVINLEAGMPTVEAARIRLDQALRSAKANRAKAVKIIHGYGSSGKGGAIKRDVQSVLARKQQAGQIKAYVPGERFSPLTPRRGPSSPPAPASQRTGITPGATMALPWCCYSVSRPVKFHELGEWIIQTKLPLRQQPKLCLHKQVRFWLALLLPLTWLLLTVTAYAPAGVERFYSRGLYPLLSGVLGRVSSLFPCSLSEITLVLLVLFVLVYLVRFIRSLVGGGGRRKPIWLRLGANVCAAAGVVYFLFGVTCGLNYNRLSFAQSSGLDVHPSPVEELLELCLGLAQEAGEARLLVGEDQDGVFALGTTSRYALAKEAQQLYPNVAGLYPVLGGYAARPKPLVLSRGMSWLDLGGIYIPFFFEPNVNGDMPDYCIPYTMMHEMSHFKGFMREEEANFLAYLACRESGDGDFVYSGNMLALTHSLNALYRADSQLYWQVREQISPEILEDMAAASAYWRQFDGPMAQVSSTVNDAYLKANRQESGVRSYGEMVDLLLAQWRAEGRL